MYVDQWISGLGLVRHLRPFIQELRLIRLGHWPQLQQTVDNHSTIGPIMGALVRRHEPLQNLLVLLPQWIAPEGLNSFFRSFGTK